MARIKLKRFEEIKSFPNVIQDWEAFKNYEFPTHNKLVLELGCGKGDYTNSLAKRHPGNFYIGFERKGERIWCGAKDSQDENTENTLFIREDIAHINKFFPKNSVDEIWITFPGPFPKDRHENRRLTSLPFLERYKHILKSNNIIHLKTDDIGLFNYTNDLIASTPNLNLISLKEDIHNIDHNHQDLDILTDFEKRHIKDGKTINYLTFQIT